MQFESNLTAEKVARLQRRRQCKSKSWQRDFGASAASQHQLPCNYSTLCHNNQTVAGLSNCTCKLRLPEERKDDSDFGHQCPKLLFFRDFSNVCISGKVRVDLDPKIFGTGNLRDWGIISRKSRRSVKSPLVNLCRDPITMNSVLDLFKIHLIQNPFLEGCCHSDNSILLRYLVRSVPSCNFLRNIPSQ